VSGHLANQNAKAGLMIGSTDAGSTHAWAEIYLPGAGGVTFDPTNRTVGDFSLIPVAVARDIKQAVPVSGSFIGASDDFLGMTVEVSVRSMTAGSGGVPSSHKPDARNVKTRRIETPRRTAVILLISRRKWSLSGGARSAPIATPTNSGKCSRFSDRCSGRGLDSGRFYRSGIFKPRLLDRRRFAIHIPSH
jgi:hypothetical protein